MSKEILWQKFIARRFLIPAIVVLLGSFHSVFPQEILMDRSFVHPGMLHTTEDLAFIKQKIESGEEPWHTAWEKLKDSRYSSLDFEPEPFAHVIRGPYGKPSIGDRELTNSSRAAHNHALIWALTGEKAHAEKAIEILNAWSGVLWDFQLNDAKLLAAWTGDSFCNAAEILRHTDSGWAEKDVEQFKRMLLTAYYPLLKDFFPEANGNWDAAIINTLLCIGIFCEDQEIFDRAVNHYLRGNGNGGITKYIYPSGQCQESTRDQTHTQLGLGEFALACQVAKNQGVDLYGAANNRLALGFEYTAKYLLGEDVPVYGEISDQGRDRLRDIYEVVFQHYHHDKGLNMTYSGRAIDKTRGGRRSGSALTFYKGVGKAWTIFGPVQASTQAPRAGAQAEPTAEQPAGATRVTPGMSIQDALDACEDGGWVVLEKGVHTIDEPLRLPNNITLGGKGIESIVMLNPDSAGQTIVNAMPDLHDVVLRDFVVECAKSPETPNDPNSQRRLRYYQKARSRAGIVLSAERTGQMQNLHFEHVTVRNATHNGVAILGATNITVVACNFSDSGSSVVPGPGLQHNLLITRSVGCEITDSRFDTSPWGSGIDVSHSRDIVISNCEVARNTLNGIRATESENIRIVGNLVEGNDGDGIVCDTLMDGCSQVEVSNNLSHNNGGHGIDVRQAEDVKVENNVLSHNGYDE